MKRYRGWIILLGFILACVGGARLILRVTAEYPGLGKPVFYPVNQVEGFEVTLRGPKWNVFTGYHIGWTVTVDSEDVYTFVSEGAGFEFLERCVDGQWYRLESSQKYFPLGSMECEMGGEGSAASGSLSSSIVQKYAYYGTRLEAGTYRVALEMHAKDGTAHYLAAEFVIE